MPTVIPNPLYLNRPALSREASERAYAAAWAALCEHKAKHGDAPPPSMPHLPGGRTYPCPYEGEIVEFCTSNCGREWRHIRQCLYEGHNFDRCVRGASGSAEVQSCTTCPHHPDAKRSEEPAAGKVVWRKGGTS